MAAPDDEKFKSFMKDVKIIEQRDTVLTPSKQIERLTKPGSKYLNLNPYEVLLITPDSTKEERKKQFKKLSILVHPDKNLGNKEKAQQAFDAVSRAYKIFDKEEDVKKIKLLLEEANHSIEEKLKEKRKEALKISPTETIPEDVEPEKLVKLRRAITCKLFADNEIARQELVQRQQDEKKRERQNEIDEEVKVKKTKEMEKQWEDTRNTRVDDWRTFQTKASKKAKKSKTFKTFRPPGVKPEKKL